MWLSGLEEHGAGDVLDVHSFLYDNDTYILVTPLVVLFVQQSGDVVVIPLFITFGTTMHLQIISCRWNLADKG